MARPKSTTRKKIPIKITALYSEITLLRTNSIDKIKTGSLLKTITKAREFELKDEHNVTFRCNKEFYVETIKKYPQLFDEIIKSLVETGEWSNQEGNNQERSNNQPENDTNAVEQTTNVRSNQQGNDQERSNQPLNNAERPTSNGSNGDSGLQPQHTNRTVTLKMNGVPVGRGVIDHALSQQGSSRVQVHLKEVYDGFEENEAPHDPTEKLGTLINGFATWDLCDIEEEPARSEVRTIRDSLASTNIEQQQRCQEQQQQQSTSQLLQYERLILSLQKQVFEKDEKIKKLEARIDEVESQCLRDHTVLDALVDFTAKMKKECGPKRIIGEMVDIKFCGEVYKIPTPEYTRFLEMQQAPKAVQTFCRMVNFPLGDYVMLGAKGVKPPLKKIDKETYFDLVNNVKVNEHLRTCKNMSTIIGSAARNERNNGNGGNGDDGDDGDDGENDDDDHPMEPVVNA